MNPLAQLFRNKFISICHELLIHGYCTIKTNKSCDRDWNEENISAHFISNMENLPLAINKKIDILREVPVDTDAIVNHGLNAKTASRIDIYFVMTTWSNPKQKHGYAVEAKNISERNWKKHSKSRVDAYTQKTKYITEGVDEFLQGNYPQGCMIAYVVQGNIANIVSDINQRILKHTDYPSKIDVLGKVTPILGFNEIYDCKCITVSIPNGVLKHFFFDLT